jgi:hypothetical protein
MKAVRLDSGRGLMLYCITTTVRLHLFRCPGVLVSDVLNVLHFSSCFLPGCFIPFRPVDVTLRKFHL